MSNRLAVFYTDASREIGGGHAMRCLSLAESLQDENWNCIFVVGENAVKTVPELAQFDNRILEISRKDDNAILANTWPEGCDLLILDDYKFDISFEDECRPWARAIFVIDDLANQKHNCDFLLDPTYGRKNEDYYHLVPPSCKILAGTNYALLKNDYIYGRLRNKRIQKRVKKIYISLGRTDPGNFLVPVLKNITGSFDNIEINVVIGGAATHLDEIQSIADTYKTVKLHIDSENIASLMSEADIAIVSASSTTWEACCMGITSVLLVTAENQKDVAKFMKNYGAAEVITDPNDLTPVIHGLLSNYNKRQDLALKARAICDGFGARRVATMINPEIAEDGQYIYLRPACNDDISVVFHWQKYINTRQFSRNPNIPSEKEHKKWMSGKLQDPDCLFNIIMYGDTPAGVLRLDQINNDIPRFEISIFTAPAYYRLGLAMAALKIIQRIVHEAEFYAEVHPDNISSHNLFRKSGFTFEKGAYFLKPGNKH